ELIIELPPQSNVLPERIERDGAYRVRRTGLGLARLDAGVRRVLVGDEAEELLVRRPPIARQPPERMQLIGAGERRTPEHLRQPAAETPQLELHEFRRGLEEVVPTGVGHVPVLFPDEAKLLREHVGDDL